MNKDAFAKLVHQTLVMYGKGLFNQLHNRLSWYLGVRASAFLIMQLMHLQIQESMFYIDPEEENKV